PSGRTGGAAAALRPASEGAMEVGRLTHLWLERFGWLEDGAPEDDELLALAAAEGWKAPEARERLTVLRAALEKPALRELLGREGVRARAAAAVGAAFQLELRREWPFALREGDALVMGQVDRLAIARPVGGGAA